MAGRYTTAGNELVVAGTTLEDHKQEIREQIDASKRRWKRHRWTATALHYLLVIGGICLSVS